MAFDEEEPQFGDAKTIERAALLRSIETTLDKLQLFSKDYWGQGTPFKTRSQIKESNELTKKELKALALRFGVDLSKYNDTITDNNFWEIKGLVENVLEQVWNKWLGEEEKEEKEQLPPEIHKLPSQLRREQEALERMQERETHKKQVELKNGDITW